LVLNPEMDFKNKKLVKREEWRLLKRRGKKKGKE
jgi:hypothetical protein